MYPVIAFLASSNVDVSPIAILIGIVGTVAGAVVGLGKRNTSLTNVQNEALQAAQTQIAALQSERALDKEKISGLTSQLSHLTARVENAERMATSRDLILDIATWAGTPETVLIPYRKDR